jgi:hypothetical protein
METGEHFDPSNVGSAKCDPSIPEKCQEGDLSGMIEELWSGVLLNLAFYFACLFVLIPFLLLYPP